MGQSRPLFRLFSSFSHHKLKKCGWSAWDSNPGPQMVGADETTELWLPPNNLFLFKVFSNNSKNSATKQCEKVFIQCLLVMQGFKLVTF